MTRLSQAWWAVLLLLFASQFVAAADRIVDIHFHFDEKNPNFIADLVQLSQQLNLTACVLTPHRDRQVVADAAKRYPTRIIPLGYVDLDNPNAVQQVEDFHALGYRGLGELEFVKKPFLHKEVANACLCNSEGRSLGINRCESILTQQKTMQLTGAEIISHDSAARVDPESAGTDSAREINRRELAPA